MTIPREKPSAVGAPVLFRLPHLHSEVSESVSRTAVSQPVATEPKPGSSDRLGRSDRSGVENASDTAGVYLSADRRVKDETNQSEASFLSGWSMATKRSVVVLAMIALVYGAWMHGQRSAQLRPESVVVDQVLPLTDRPAVASQQVADESKDGVRVAQGGSEVAGRSPERSVGFSPVTEPEDSFYVPEEMPSVEVSELSRGLISEPVEDPTTRSEVSTTIVPPLDELAAPANLSADNVSASSTAVANPAPAASAQKPPLGDAASISSSDGDHSVAKIAPADSNFATSATPDLPGFDTAAVDSYQPPSVSVPIKSTMPNAIVDWYRYLPGGTGAVRAASSTSSVGPIGGQQPQVGNQAFYVDDIETPASTNGVAPFYR